MSPFLAELLGTMLLIILGDGVVANVVLSQTKGQNSGWIVITAGWAFAVTVAVYAVGTFSGAHLNPAVTIGLASIEVRVGVVPGYIAAQMIGRSWAPWSCGSPTCPIGPSRRASR
jgi:glycerol uptake facilitator protein